MGTYLMVQGLALFGDAISGITGLAIGFIVGADVLVGAFTAGVPV